ncbi:MAG: hypothetical protein AW09_000520 [Candidatus Accumulibacter phosphatis]|uniref:Uncharacterized protein n=1 Tax=Candidatus Accumulibacter phosphatis TaxID=327160 RepID=A0A080MAQ0_9PROT|nr:MAG: hypothetical protein AW09_000520 [Candidatus Accumulibacter phosphatis]
MLVVAVTVAAIVRVDADDDQAVVDVAADAQAGEGAGAEVVGGVAAAADHGVAAEVGADAHAHRLEAAADLQELQRAGGELAGSVAANDELGQRTADIGAPVGARALAADAVGAAVDRPQAANRAADLCRAEDETAHPAARQAQVAEGVTADVEAGETVALETGAGGDVAEVQGVHGGKARDAGQAGDRRGETAERTVGVEAGQRDAAVAAAAGEIDARAGVGAAETQLVAAAVRRQAGDAGAGDRQAQVGTVGVGEVECRHRCAAGQLADGEVEGQRRTGDRLVVGFVALGDGVVGIDDADQGVASGLGDGARVEADGDGVAARVQPVGGEVGLADQGVVGVEDAVRGGVELDAHRVHERLAVGAMDGEVGADGVAGDGRAEGVVAEAAADEVGREEEARFEKFEVQAGTGHRRCRLSCPERALVLQPAGEPAIEAAEKREEQRADAPPAVDCLAKRTHAVTPLGGGRQRARDGDLAEGSARGR